jgi:hypothetical protein
MRLNSLDKKIKYRIARSNSNVFLFNDFADLSGKNQIGRALRGLAKDGSVVKIGRGVYAKAKYSPVFKKNIPTKPLKELGLEMLDKLGVETAPTYYEQQYNKGFSTQVPTGRVIGVKGRVSRKLSYNGAEIYYERVS